MRERGPTLRPSGIGASLRRTLSVPGVLALTGCVGATAGEIRRAAGDVTETVTSGGQTVHSETAFELSVSANESVDVTLEAAESAVDPTERLPGE